MASLTDAVQEDPDRFAQYAREDNPRMKDFRDFVEAIERAFDTENGRHGKFSEQDYKKIFETETIKNTVINNVSEDEFDEIYNDDQTREVGFSKSGKPEVTIVVRTVATKSYSRNGHTVKPYTRTFHNWSSAEVKFLKVRKDNNVPRKQIINEYKTHFQKKNVTSSAISTRLYRL